MQAQHQEMNLMKKSGVKFWEVVVMVCNLNQLLEMQVMDIIINIFQQHQI